MPHMSTSRGRRPGWPTAPLPPASRCWLDDGWIPTARALDPGGGGGSGVDVDQARRGRVDGPLGGVVGQRRGSAAPGRAQGAVLAPVAEPARAGTPVAGARCVLDGGPQRLDLALDPEEVLLVGLVGDDLAVAEVDELEAAGDLAAQSPQHERVELHLEQ